MSQELTIHHHFARYFKDESLEPYLYVLSKRMESGHICIPVDESINQDLLRGGYKTEKKSLTENELVTFATSYDSDLLTELKPFVYYNHKLYLQRNFVYENQVLENLNQFSKNDYLEVRKNQLNEQKVFISNVISKPEDISTYTEIEKVDWQAIAAMMGALNNLTIITGGPGTGKTTTVAKIIALLKRMDGDQLSIALAAPTGKAAMRMKESLQNSAQNNKELEIESIVKVSNTYTIHRLLGVNLNSPFFKHNSKNKLPYDVIIIDEASMIGVALFAKLVTAVKEGTRIILLGDSEQLASVDAGTLFGDICLSQKENENRFTSSDTEFFNSFIQHNRQSNIPTLEQYGFLNSNFVRLKKTYRFDQASQLGDFTKAIIEGNQKGVAKMLENSRYDSLKLDDNYNESFFKDFVLKYKVYIEETDIQEALKNSNLCRVLCAVKQSDQGVYKVNEKIKLILKNEYRSRPELFNPTNELYHNQLIMVTKNQPDIKLFNGDVGLVRKDDDGRLKVYFPALEEVDGAIKESFTTKSPGFIDSWETVFAMTIHKSQGSEFNEVLVILPKKKENRLLTRELVYTGITRAKNCAYVQTTPEVLLTAVNQGVYRVSGLKDRILKKN